MRRVLLIGCGGSASIGIANSLKKSAYLFGVDTNPYKILRSQCHRTQVIPVLEDKQYIEELNEIIYKQNIDFLHAQPFNEVYTVSKYREKLGCKTFLPCHKTVEICTDKYLSYLQWKKMGIQVPETRIIFNVDDVINMVSKYGKCWVRAPTGAGGLGSIIVDKTNIKFVLSLLNYWKGFKSFLVSEYLSPTSVTFMTIWKNGELYVAQSRERIYWEFGSKTLSGVSGITGASKTVSRSDVIQVGLDSIKAIDNCPNGIFSVDMTYDSNGFPCPTEINIGKFFTTIQFFTEAGINFPEIYLDLGMGDVEVMKRGINPLPNDLIWIRGMDINPILTEMKKIE